MPKTFYTIDDLYQFCKTNQFERFSSKEHENKPLIVQSIETFESADNSKDGLLPVQLKACHIGANRNKSSISEESMKKYMSSFKGRPILGAIYKTDTGEYEFRGHDMKIVEDGDGATVESIEQPVGVISEINEPYLEYDEAEDKTYLMVSGNVFEDYSKAAEILKRRKTCKCSVEIAVDELSWDGKEEVLSIDVFSFRGVTILGFEQDGVTEIAEGMKGSKITIDNFSAEQNSMFSENYQEKLLESLDKLNKILSKFSIEDATQKGVENEDMDHFEELLEKYGITADEVDFLTDGLSDEELDAAFEEHFAGCKKKKKCDATSEDEAEAEAEAEADGEDDEFAGCKKKKKCENENEEDGNEDESNEEDFVGCKKKRKCSIDENGNVAIEYELSHDDIRAGIYALLREESDDDYFWPWIVEVYDSKFIYEDEWTGKFYRRNYTKDGDNIAFSGDAVEVFNEWLSQEEKDALDALKQSYSELKQFKEQYDAAELKAKKDAIFEKSEYSILADEDAFKALVKDAEKFSVEEVESKVKSIFADYVIKTGTFSAKDDGAKSTQTLGFNFNAKGKKTGPYGNLFADKD